MILAQYIGGAGFLVLIAATQVRRRRLFLAVDFVGLAPVVAHYILLDAFAGAAMSALYMLIDLTVAYQHRSLAVRRAFWVYYLVAGFMIAFTYQGPFDLLALAGTLAAVVARQQPTMRRLLVGIILSCVGWAAYGYFAGSFAQIAFSTTYALASAVGLLRLPDRQTHT